jgi:DNA-binding NarL/FixJ family response regulator
MNKLGHESGPSLKRSADAARIRVLIADDHAIFAESLRVVLEKKYVIVGIVGDGRTLISEAARLKPDVAIIDIGMPLLNGFDAARRAREENPKIKLVFLTMRDDPNLAAAALELGAVGFVLKHSATAELLTAIECVLRNESYLTPKLRAEDWVTSKNRASQYSKTLTPRQREVVQLFAEGWPIKQIASHLNLSEKTIEFHKHHIMASFNLKSNADLVLFALKHGLISDPEIALLQPKIP